MRLLFGVVVCGLWLCIRWGSTAPLGLNKCVSMMNPGLVTWAMQEYRPVGAHCPTAPIPPPSIPQKIQSQSNKYTNTTEHNNPFAHPNTFNEHNTMTQHRKCPIRQRALQGRHSRKAQGGMRAKPEMQPWVNTDKSGLSSVGAALTVSVCLKTIKFYFRL